MAAKISYVIEFQNLDQSITKLSKLNQLLDSIGRKGGDLGGGTAGVPKPNLTPTGGGGIGYAALAAAISATSTHLNKLNKTLNELSLARARAHPFHHSQYFAEGKAPYLKGYGERVIKGGGIQPGESIKDYLKRVGLAVAHTSVNIGNKIPKMGSDVLGGIPFFAPQFWAPLAKDLKSIFGKIFPKVQFSGGQMSVSGHSFFQPGGGMDKAGNWVRGIFGKGFTGLGNTLSNVGKMANNFGKTVGGLGHALNPIMHAMGVPREIRMGVTHFAKLGGVIGMIILGLIVLKIAIENLVKGIEVMNDVTY